MISRNCSTLLEGATYNLLGPSYGCYPEFVELSLGVLSRTCRVLPGGIIWSLFGHTYGCYLELFGCYKGILSTEWAISNPAIRNAYNSLTKQA